MSLCIIVAIYYLKIMLRFYSSSITVKAIENGFNEILDRLAGICINEKNELLMVQAIARRMGSPFWRV
jgi:hypothetical protein